MTENKSFSSKLISILGGFCFLIIICAGIGLAVGTGWRAYNWVINGDTNDQTQNCAIKNVR